MNGIIQPGFIHLSLEENLLYLSLRDTLLGYPLTYLLQRAIFVTIHLHMIKYARLLYTLDLYLEIKPGGTTAINGNIHSQE